MVLLGSKASARNVEQHDYYFGIASSLKELKAEFKAFWPEAGSSLHVDGWREVNRVDGYQVTVVARTEENIPSANRLFFINLGGYQAGKMEEQHYTLLTVQQDLAAATRFAKRTAFFKGGTVKAFKGATAHIDDKYGVDVDEVYPIEDLLSPLQKSSYQIRIEPAAGTADDEIHLGYFKLDRL